MRALATSCGAVGASRSLLMRCIGGKCMSLTLAGASSATGAAVCSAMRRSGRWDVNSKVQSEFYRVPGRGTRSYSSLESLTSR